MGIRLPGRGANESVLWELEGPPGPLCVVSANSGKPSRPQACGRTLLNDLGLFDVLGNMNEWCQDRYGPENDHKEATRMQSSMQALACFVAGRSTIGRRSSARRTVTGTRAANHHINYGFRLARTYN